jgi:hypothetical protein
VPGRTDFLVELRGFELMAIAGSQAASWWQVERSGGDSGRRSLQARRVKMLQLLPPPSTRGPERRLIGRHP